MIYHCETNQFCHTKNPTVLNKLHVYLFDMFNSVTIYSNKTFILNMKNEWIYLNELL